MAKYKWPEIVRVEDRIASVRRQLGRYDGLIRNGHLVPQRWNDLMIHYFDLIERRRKLERDSKAVCEICGQISRPCYCEDSES